MLAAIYESRLAILGFTVGIAYIPGLMSAAYMPRWWAIAVLVPMTSRIDPRAIDPWVGACLLAAIGWAVFLQPSMPHPHAGAFEVYLLMLLALVAMAGASDDAGAVILWLARGVAVSAALAVGQMAFIPSGSPVGLFTNPEVLAEMAAPLAVWAAWERRFALGALLAIPLAICGARGALLAAGIGLLAGWTTPNRWVRTFLLAGLLAIGVASLLAMGAGKGASGLSRMVLWGTAVHSITWTGGGLGWWAAAHPGPMEEFVHSDVLQAIVELGVGAAFLLAIPVMVLMRGDGDVPQRCAFVALCVEGAISFPLHVPATAFLAFLLAGQLARRRVIVRGLRRHGGDRAGASPGWKDASYPGMAGGGGYGGVGVSMGPPRHGDGGFDPTEGGRRAVDAYDGTWAEETALSARERWRRG